MANSKEWPGALHHAEPDQFQLQPVALLNRFASSVKPAPLMQQGGDHG
jgi:hypothetical protein